MVDARQFVARAVLAAHPARPGRALAVLRESQWWEPERMEELRVAALRNVLDAAAAVPFHDERMRAAGLVPSDVRSVEDVAALPPLERGDLQRLGVDGLRVPGRHGLRCASSGSTGTPVEGLWPREMIAWSDADDRRCNGWLGVAPGERRVWLAASPSTASLRRRLASALTNVTLVPSRTLAGPEVVDALAESLDRRPAALVWGQSNGLYAFARGLLDAGRRVRVGACWSEGNHLPGYYREPIEEALGCRVLERYGSWETGMIAHQCPEEQSYHVSAETVLIEIVRDDGRAAAPGEIGHILVTQLRNDAMPLLRYRIGDLAIPTEAERCSCGRRLPLLGTLVGRSNELLRAGDGGLVLPEHVSALMTSLRESVVEFQVVQHDDLHVSVKVVQRDSPPPEPVRERVASGIDELLRLRGAAHVERVDSIPLSTSGKLRHIVVADRAGADPER